MKTIIVSRHPAAIAFARSDMRFVHAEVLAQASEEDVRDAIVAGNIPLRLAAIAKRYFAIELPAITFEQRGIELNSEEMCVAGAQLVEYKVLTREQVDAINLASNHDCGYSVIL